VVASAPLVTKSVTPESPKTLDEFCQQFGKKTVTWAGLMKVLLETDAVIIKKMKAMNEKNVLRNQRTRRARAGERGSTSACPRIGSQRRCAHGAACRALTPRSSRSTSNSYSSSRRSAVAWQRSSNSTAPTKLLKTCGAAIDGSAINSSNSFAICCALDWLLERVHCRRVRLC
jgi:hypothetical protein